MRLAIIMLTVFYVFFGGIALYGLWSDEVLNIMVKDGSIGEQIIWQSAIFDRGLMCLGFAITWLIVIPWHIKKIKGE